MEDYIAPLLLFIVLFVGFGLSQRGKQESGNCAGCSGSCSGKSECKNEKTWPSLNLPDLYQENN